MVNPSNNNDQPTRRRRTSKGKQKIEIKKIENKTSRSITFSKRRNGLFSKCYDLCSKFNSEVALITFTIAGNPVAVGYPSVDSVIQRYINDSTIPRSKENMGFEEIGDINWWDNPIDNMGFEEIERFKESLEGFRDKINTNLANKDGEIINSNNNLGCVNNGDGLRVVEISPNYGTNGAINGDEHFDYLEIMELSRVKE